MRRDQAFEAHHLRRRSGNDLLMAVDADLSIALQVGQRRRIVAGARVGAGVVDQSRRAVQPRLNTRELRPGGHELVVDEAAVVLEHHANALIVLDPAVGDRRDAVRRHDAGAVIVRDDSPVDDEIARAVGQDDAGDTIVLHATAVPAQRAGLTVIDAVCKSCAAVGIADHPGVGDHAFEHAADDVEADTANPLHSHVAHRPVVEPAGRAIRDDLDAVALLAVALEGEVRERQVADVGVRRDVDLDDRTAIGDLRHDRGAAEIDSLGIGVVGGDVDDDGFRHHVGLGRQVGDVTGRQRIPQGRLQLAAAVAVGHGSRISGRDRSHRRHLEVDLARHDLARKSARALDRNIAARGDAATNLREVAGTLDIGQQGTAARAVILADIADQARRA